MTLTNEQWQEALVQLANSGITPPASAVSTANSTTTPLSANATFTGTWESALAYGSISVQVYSDQASASNGLIIEQSQDGTNADTQATYSVSAATASQQTVNLTGQYFRIVYTNGGTNQATFRLQTIKEVYASPSAGVANQRVHAQSGDFATGSIADLATQLALLQGAITSNKMATKAASGDFADGAITTIGTEADSAWSLSGNATLVALLKKLDLLLQNVAYDNTNELKSSLYGKNSAAGDTAVGVDSSGYVYTHQKLGGSDISTSNPMPVNTVAQAGEVALYGSNASALTANTDAAIKWGASGTTAVNHILIQNNDTNNLHFHLDATATAGSPILAPGQTILLDIAGTLAVHLYSAGTPNVNGSSANNVVVTGWL